VGLTMGIKALMEERKKNVDKRKVIEDKVVIKTVCSVDRGHNHIFTKTFIISKTDNGDVYINSIHKVKIMSCDSYIESHITKSTTKKILGAATGGNNKKVNNKFNKLVAIDESGMIHEIILKEILLQRSIFETYIYKGEST
jgi:hypothetical protein